jgi:hypothetical protein
MISVASKRNKRRAKRTFLNRKEKNRKKYRKEKKSDTFRARNWSTSIKILPLF